MIVLGHEMAAFDSALCRKALELLGAKITLKSEIVLNDIKKEEEDTKNDYKLRMAVITEQNEQRKTACRRLAEEKQLLDSYKKESKNLTKKLEDLKKEQAALLEASRQTEDDGDRLVHELGLLSLEEKQSEEAVQTDTKLEHSHTLAESVTGIHWEDSNDTIASGLIATSQDLKPFTVNLKEKSHAYACQYIWNLMEEGIQ